MTKTEELRELRNALDDLIETEATKILTAHQFLELPGFDKIMDAIVAVSHAEGVAEGAEQMKETIRQWIDEPDPANVGQRIHVSVFGEFQLVNLTDLLSVLAPKEKPERGKPSQALLDELSEICGGKVEYVTKEEK